MNAEQRERAIVRNMQALRISRKEAEELVADDEAVDRGEAMPWDLTPEQMKNARKLANATTRKTGTKVNRTKKENPDKQFIIDTVFKALENVTEGAKISNTERTVDFTLNGVSYTVTLTAHRK